MSASRFLDTNVLVYLFQEDAPEKQARAREILRSGREAGDLVISTQVLQEFFVTVTRKLSSPLPAEEALATIHDFGELPVVITDAALVFEAGALSIRHQISFWDALILEAARAAHCEVVLSEDLQHGWRVQGLEIQNPFLAS